jgi:hypothetical protein
MVLQPGAFDDTTNQKVNNKDIGVNMHPLWRL